jgi:hypothetical protein
MHVKEQARSTGWLAPQFSLDRKIYNALQNSAGQLNSISGIYKITDYSYFTKASSVQMVQKQARIPFSIHVSIYAAKEETWSKHF